MYKLKVTKNGSHTWIIFYSMVVQIKIFPLGIGITHSCQNKGSYLRLVLGGTGAITGRRAGRERKDVPTKLKIPLVSLYMYLYTNAHS